MCQPFPFNSVEKRKKKKKRMFAMKVRRVRKYVFRFSMDGIAEATYT